MFRILTYGVLWLLLLGVTILAGQNPTPVTIVFLVFRSVAVPLGLVLVFFAGLGALVATILQEASSSESPSQSSTEATSPYQSTYRYQYTPDRKKGTDDWDDQEAEDWID